MSGARRSRRHAGDARGENGFTLIEVVITVVLLAMITGAISAAFVTTLELSSKTAKRANESNDTGQIATFLARDAQAVGATDPVSGATNPDYGVTVGSDAGCLVTSGSPVVRFKWLDRSTAAAKQDNIAVYYYLPAAGTQPGHLERQVCVGTPGTPKKNPFSASLSAKPSVTCAPACTGSPDTVSLTFAEVQTITPYSITVSTRPEGQTTTNADTTPAPLVLIGNPACGGASPLSGNGNVPLKVYGSAFIESGASGSCAATNVDNYTVTGSNEAIAPAQCAGLAKCNPIGGITARDPFAGKLTAPTASGSLSGCSGPGLYPGGLSITTGTCTLASGVYVVRGGISVSTGAAINTDAGGVLIYLESGPFVVDGKLSASPIAGQYDGIVLWQAAADNTTLTTAAGASVHLNGTVYAPGAEFQAAKRVAMKGLVAKGLSLGAASAINADDRSQIGLITPTVTSMTPSTIDQVINPTHETITIVGTNFVDGLSVSFPDDPGITVTNPVDFVSSTEIRVDIFVQPSANAGTDTVMLKNPDEGIDVEADQFTVEALPVISSVKLANVLPNIPGELDAGDTITVVFSKQMRVSSFCAVWANDAVSQPRVPPPTDITVNVSDGAASANTISVDSPTGCGLGQNFHFGTIDLGATTYVTGGPATFGGALATTPSTITWDANTRTLVITLGTKGGTGVVAPVASSLPTYAADPGIRDTLGGPLSNSPFTFPAGGQQF